MKTKTTFLAMLAFAFLALTAKAQYHEDDKAALRNFLKRPSAEAGKMNGEQVGLSASTINMNGWLMNDTWLTALQGVTWNTESPKRIITIDWTDKKLADTLNLGRCTSLTELWCRQNQITNLDVTKNTALTHLICYNNQLTNLDVSKNTALTYLSCFDNLLTNLDVTKNTALTTLYCDYNQITNLDVTKNTALISLSCSQNQLTNLDVSKNTALTYLSCSQNQLTNLDVSKNTALTYLSCSQNQLTNLNVTKNTALTGLDCYYNQLTNLDVSKNTALTDLRCYNNQLKFSTLPKGTYTTFAYVPQDTLQGGSAGYSRIIDLSSENNIAGNVSTYSWYDGASEIMANKYVNTNGKFLFTDGTYINKTLICKITNAKFPSLTLIYKVKLIPEEYHTADKTALRNFLIQNSADTLKTNGEKLNLGPAELEILKTAADWKTNESWVSKVAALEWNTEIPKKITLMFWNNRNFAGNLDVSGCDSLKRLSCFSNQLTNLDISKNIALTGLYCNSNQLTNLDVSKNTALTDLECIDNKLTNLDVTKNTALKRLHCSNNQLKFSTLPKGTYTTFIYAPQDTLQGSSIKIGSEIDLSSEYSIASNITTYKWFDGDTEIPAAEYTAANGKFTFSNASFLNKTLTCQMTNATFPDFDTKPLIYQVKITDGTGIAETGNSEIQLAIYPNPTTGELKIVTHNPLKGANELGKSPLGDLGVQLFDLTGKQVFETRKTEFNIGHLPNGLYLLKATTDKGVVNRKIVKE